MLKIIRDRDLLTNRLRQIRDDLGDDLLVVQQILSRVRKEGDEAVRNFTEKFDRVSIGELHVPVRRLEKAAEVLPVSLKKSIKEAGENIRRFHELQKPAGYSLTQPDGTETAFRWRASVGVYVPGGRFPLFSTVLMNVIPAQVAGVPEIVVCSPPGQEGWPSNEILGTCFLLGVTEVYRVGGVQAIGALTYGTESIPAVYKITGPGNKYVAQAKQVVSDYVGIDMVAGPTELVVIADGETDPRRAAAELLSQAEHDPQAFPVLLTDSEDLAEKVNKQLSVQIADLSTRSTAEQALEKQGFTFIAGSIEECVRIANSIAPEHLALMVKKPEPWIDKLTAGAIFVGADSPIAWGDYWAGPNHTLPTSGKARIQGPLSVLDFMVPYSVIRVDQQVLRNSGEKVREMAETEGLSGHAGSIAVRRKNG
ncbi:MAG: histidinol dehydrogenase [FCB group bacterium]|nr:histidinol dehydrogenase [FCB group bacterium]